MRVQALEDRRLLALDFGNAPNPYPVSLEDDGARHDIITKWEPSSELFGTGFSSYCGSDGFAISNDRETLLATELIQIYDQAIDRFTSRVDLVIYNPQDQTAKPKVLATHEYQIRGTTTASAVAMNGNGDLVAWITGNADFSASEVFIEAFQFSEGEWVGKGSDISLPNGGEQIVGIQLSAEGNRFAVQAGQTLRVFDWLEDDWVNVAAFANHESFSLSSDGNSIVFADTDGLKVRRYDDINQNWSQPDYILNSFDYRSLRNFSISDDGGIVVAGGSSTSTSTNTSFVYRFDSIAERYNLEDNLGGGRPCRINGFGDEIACFGGTSDAHMFFRKHDSSWQPQYTINLPSENIFGSGGSISHNDRQYSHDSKSMVFRSAFSSSRGHLYVYQLDPQLQLGANFGHYASDVGGQTPETLSSEDGVIFESNLISAAIANLSVDIVGGDGRLDGWIDFNQDGIWQPLSEQVFSSYYVTEGSNQLSFSIPADAKPGSTFARFRLSEEEGLLPTGYATSGEVEDYEVVISSIRLDNAQDTAMKLLLREGDLVASDESSGLELGTYRSDILPRNVYLFGNVNHTTHLRFERLTDHQSPDPEQVQTYSFTGGETQGDGVTIESDANLWAWLDSQNSTSERLVIDLRDGEKTLNRYELQSVETINIGEVDRVAFSSDQFDIGTTVYDVSPSKPVNLPLDTSIAGGTFRSTSTLGLHTAESLDGFGIIDAGFAGSRGSLVRLSGEMTIGDFTSSAGFNTDGLVEVGANALTIQDANQATLGELTTLGDAAQPGAITAANGLYLDFTGNIEGHGTIETVNGDATNVFLNNGTLSGNSSEQPLYVNSLIKGVGTLNNVVIQGTFSPGFSPTLSVNGVVTYADQSNIEIELGGLLRGSQYDRIEHELAALAGRLDVKLIDGFLPVPGDLFEVIASAQSFVGSLNSVQMPVFENGIRLLEQVGDSNIDLSTVFDVKDQLTVSDSEPGAFRILDWNGETLSINGDRFQAFVSPLNHFSAASVWWNDEVISTDAGWTQIATDGNHSIEIEGSGWKNFVRPSDVNNSGDVTSLDALSIINELSVSRYSDEESRQLLPISEVGQWPGAFYDQNGDGACTALDALRVINDLARESAAAGEGEALPADYGSPFDASSDTAGTLAGEFESLVVEADERSSQLTSDYEDPGAPVSIPAVEALKSVDSSQPQVDAVDKLLSDGFDWLK